ncbi:MAG: hypothetical protein ABI333_23765 [bacterium]
MATNPCDLLGGNTLYAVNLTRVDRAVTLAYEDPDSGPRIRASLERLEDELDGNERAAIALVMIDRLLRDVDGAGGR